MIIKSFKVNDYLTLKLEKGKTNIYINNEKFILCKSLILEVPIDDTVLLGELESIDEFSDNFKNSVGSHQSRSQKIPSEVEFWGHCSNMQMWVEHNYNTNLLHSNIAFPLLKRLTEAGDLIAQKVFKDEIIKRIQSEYIPTVIYLITSNFLDFFSQEEFEVLIEDIKNHEYLLEKKTLDLIYSFKDKYLGVHDLVFLIEHPKINFFELMIEFGKELFEKDGEYIGECRLWITDLLHKLVEREPRYLASKINELILEDIIKVREYEIPSDRWGFKEVKIDYSLMDEFSILLYNRLRHSLMKYNV